MTPPASAPDACPYLDDPASQTLADAVNEHDIDRAIALGLLAFEPASHRCDRCRDRIANILAARDARLRALAARERFRARETRLAERAEARARKRAAAVPAAAPGKPAPPTLPPAAAAALARAKAKVAAKPPE